MHAIVTDKKIREQIENRILEMMPGDYNLFNIIREETSSLREKAWKKLQNRIERGFLKKPFARKILFEVFRHVIELRLEAWRIVKTLDPTTEELQRMLDLDCMKSMPDTRHEAEKLVRKRYKRKTFNAEKTIRKIIELS